MTKKEFDQMVKQMHEQGLSDDDIMEILYETFMSKECDLKDFEVMSGWLGYELTDEFYKEHGVDRYEKD